MASKFLNLSTDTTLGGNAPSDEIVSSQKALKTYIDNNAGGGGLPDQTGNSGKFLTTDGTDASWSDKPLVNTATGNKSLTILGTATTNQSCVNIGTNSVSQATGAVAVGYTAKSKAINCISIGYMAVTNQGYSISIGNDATTKGEVGISIGLGAGNGTSTPKYATSVGYYATTTATGAYQFGYGTNSEAGTVCFALNTDGSSSSSHWTNYKLLDSNGTIPTDRFTTTPSADGTYVPTLTISSGVATRSWSAPGGGSSYTAGTGIDITSDVISVDLTAGDGIGVSGATISLGNIDCGVMSSPNKSVLYTDCYWDDTEEPAEEPSLEITYTLSNALQADITDVKVNGTSLSAWTLYIDTNTEKVWVSNAINDGTQEYEIGYLNIYAIDSESATPLENSLFDSSTYELKYSVTTTTGNTIIIS